MVGTDLQKQNISTNTAINALVLRRQPQTYSEHAPLIASQPHGGNQPHQSLLAPDTSPQQSIRILRLPEVMARVGMCRASIYQHMNAGVFPKQITLGVRAVGWLEHEIAAWLVVRIQARQGKGTYA